MRINWVARGENCFFQTLLIIELHRPGSPMAYRCCEQMRRLLIKIVRSFPRAKHPHWGQPQCDPSLCSTVNQRHHLKVSSLSVHPKGSGTRGKCFYLYQGRIQQSLHPFLSPQPFSIPDIPKGQLCLCLSDLLV